MARAALGVTLVLLALAGTQAATFCAPGTGLKNFDFFGFLGGIISGDTGTSESATCKPCGSWEASKGGYDAQCELCVPLLSAPNAFKTGCDCLPGTYVGPTTSDASSVAKNCISCGANAVSSTRNAASCTACPAGAVAGKNNKCSCPTGFRATGINENGVTGCIKCAEGLVSPGGLSDKCTACADGTVPLPSGDYCGCLPGTRMANTLAADGDETKCTSCSSVFEYTAEANRLMMCQQCYPYSYATADHTGCECSGGYYAEDPLKQPVRCRPCPQGTYKAAAGNAGIEACIACPQGLEPSGSQKSCVTPLCPAGTETQPDGSCKMCDEHSYNYRRGGTCQPCLNNTVASPDRTKCDACVMGYVQTSDTGASLACMDCMPGWTWNDSTSKCDLDLVGATTTVPEVPDDEAYLAHMPVQTLAPAKMISTGTVMNKAQQMMTFNANNELQQDDAYMNANKQAIFMANKNAARAIAAGDPDAADLVAP